MAKDNYFIKNTSIMQENRKKNSTVSIKNADSYDFSLVLETMRLCLEPLGGIKSFVSPGQKVLLKPNLLTGFHPDRAVTTHPTFVKAATMICLEAGAQVQIGDSPGIGELAHVFRKCGMESLLKIPGVSLANFGDTKEFSEPDNVVGRKIRLAKAVADADVIITLPKLKTHSQMGFTGALKNQYGLIVGAEKAHYHYRLKDRNWLAELIIDINNIAKPALAIMDGIYAMEGMGPAGGEPRHLGVMLASSDIVAVDTMACHLITLNTKTLPISVAAAKRHFGATDFEQINVVGDDHREKITTDFKKVPELSNILRLLPLPRFVLGWIRRIWAPRPRIISDKCIKCNACGRGCPVKPAAINPFADEKNRVNDQSCIRCYCCHEFCPEKAIELEYVMPIRWIMSIRRGWLHWRSP